MLATAFTLLLTTGCDQGTTPARAVRLPRPVVPPGDATIGVQVRFDGPTPEVRTLGPFDCCGRPTTMPDESLVVGPGGGLANVIVFLEDGPNVAATRPTTPSTQPIAPAAQPANGGSPAAALPTVSLDQRNCRYVPHVLALRTGQTLLVTSSDPTMHNVHATPASNRSFNLGFTNAGESQAVVFAEPELGIQVRCDVHPWMNARLAVFDHPFYGLTGPDGEFDLREVPAGTYTLVAWHERFGSKKLSVTVGPAQTVAATFNFGK